MENNQPSKQPVSTGRGNALQRIKQLPKKPLIILGVVILVTGSVAGAYQIGFNRGHDAGKAQAKKEQVTNPFSLPLGQSPFSTFLSGKISKIDDDSITIDSNKGQKETIQLTDKTKITKKTTTLKKSDLKVGQKVTIFPNSQDKQTALRIVVRDY